MEEPRWRPRLNPVRWLTPGARLPAALILFGVSVAVVIAFRSVANLTTPQAPRGMTSLQFAATLERARAIVQSWHTHGLDARSGFNLGVDYLFIVGYAVFGVVLSGGLADHFAGKKGAPHVVCYSMVIAAWLVILAAWFDVIENAFLFQMITGSLTAGNVQAATLLARIKWSVVLVAMGIFLVAFVVAFISTSRRTAPGR
jgi:hypothetical protein